MSVDAVAIVLYEVNQEHNKYYAHHKHNVHTGDASNPIPDTLEEKISKAKRKMKRMK